MPRSVLTIACSLPLAANSCVFSDSGGARRPTVRGRSHRGVKLTVFRASDCNTFPKIDGTVARKRQDPTQTASASRAAARIAR